MIYLVVAQANPSRGASSASYFKQLPGPRTGLAGVMPAVQAWAMGQGVGVVAIGDAAQTLAPPLAGCGQVMTLIGCGRELVEHQHDQLGMPGTYP